MKPIETNYKNHKFRSRLEARYAVFFDAIGLKWIYEMEGYILQNGQCYLPDFYLPELDCFVEIKPDSASMEDTEKARIFGKEKSIALMKGLPSNKPFKVFSPFDQMQDYLFQFVKKNGRWRFWATHENSNDTTHLHNEAIKRATQAQFEYQVA